jgi:peptidoglycan/xylan/chitin deacetylase (PgdA/CDA1 family)
VNPKVRRILKRGLKWGVEWTAAASGLAALYRRSRAFKCGYRILTYHRIEDNPRDSFSVKTDHFRAHIAFLADHYRVVPLERMVRDMQADRGHGEVAITFDDGYRELTDVVAPSLERRRIPATFFVVTGILDGKVKVARRDHVSWDDVRALAERRFSIGAHGVTHKSLGEAPLEEAESEIRESRQRILEETGAAPCGLAYPYGTYRDCSPELAEIVRRSGYDFAVTAIHGLNRHGCNPYLLRRVNVSEGDGLRTFRLIMKGCLDAWAFVDKYASRFQKP